jgi:hypothetical protein
MKSWKTTLGGIGTILGSIAAAIKMYQSGDISSAVAAVITGISAGLGLIFARDNTVPSAAVPAAQKRADEIKADTAFIIKG